MKNVLDVNILNQQKRYHHLYSFLLNMGIVLQIIVRKMQFQRKKILQRGKGKKLINFSNPKINEFLDTFYSTPFFWMPYIDFCFGTFTMHFDETDKDKKEK